MAPLCARAASEAASHAGPDLTNNCNSSPVENMSARTRILRCQREGASAHRGVHHRPCGAARDRAARGAITTASCSTVGPGSRAAPTAPARSTRPQPTLCCRGGSWLVSSANSNTHSSPTFEAYVLAEERPLSNRQCLGPPGRRDSGDWLPRSRRTCDLPGVLAFCTHIANPAGSATEAAHDLAVRPGLPPPLDRLLPGQSGHHAAQRRLPDSWPAAGSAPGGLQC